MMYDVSCLLVIEIYCQIHVGAQKMSVVSF